MTTLEEEAYAVCLDQETGFANLGRTVSVSVQLQAVKIQGQNYVTTIFCTDCLH